MRIRTRWWRVFGVLVALALVAAACGDDEGGDDTTTTTSAETTTTTSADTTTTTSGDTTTTAPPGEQVATDFGVTEEPCPDGDPNRGCIYLGTITDEAGPFAQAAPALFAAKQAFWARVNAAGGIGGAYDVAVPAELKVSNDYVPATHVEVYAGIKDEVLALAESLGTSQSLAALPEYEADSVVALPATWWSGWAFRDQDAGLILESGANYCAEAMNSVDWAVGAIPDVATVGVIFLPNDYGQDYLAGVRLAAEANGLEVAFQQATIPVSFGGDPAQTEAVTAAVTNNADVTFIVAGPTETGAIVGGAAAQGHQKPFVGAGPTWNVGILQTAAAPAFEAGLYFNSAPWGPWDTDSAGHEAMRAAAEAAGVPPSNFFAAGWVWQYSMLAALEQAYGNGDLTRAGLVAAAQELTSVDYEGMLPAGAGNYAADGDAAVVRESLIAAIDSGASDGLAVVQDFFAGPSVSDFEFTAPCAAV